jgi:membrane-associated phospholipid phosphatase
MKTRLAISFTLLSATIAAALLIRHFPGTNAIDRWGFRIIPTQIFVSWPLENETNQITAAIVGLIGVLGALTVRRRDRLRAVACIVGPMLAGLMTLIVLKPLSGKKLGGALAFPSGLVAGVSTIVAVALLVMSRRWRLVAFLPAVAAIVAVMWFVVALRWHYATDALTGAAVGVASVMFADSSIHLVARLGARRRSQGELDDTH